MITLYLERKLNVGVDAQSSNEAIKRTRLFNAVNNSSRFIVLFLAIRCATFGATACSALNIGFLCTTLICEKLIQRRQMNLAHSLGLIYSVAFICAMHLLYGDTVASFVYISSIVSAVFIFANTNIRNLWFIVGAMLMFLEIVLAVSGTDLWPTTTFPIPEKSSRALDLLFATILTAASFALLRRENEQSEARLKRERDELNNINRELSATKQSMIQSAKLGAIGEMAMGMAHEVNNPLTIVLGNAYLLQAELLKPNQSRENSLRYIDTILTQSTRIGGVVRSLRVYSSETDRFEENDVSEILKNSCALVENKLAAEGIHLKISLPEYPVTAECRAAQIAQTILALIQNASDAVKNTGERWITVSLTNTTESVEIAIVDSGPGIPDAIVDKIMLPFFTTKQVGSGQGIGLSTSQAIITAHQGSLILDRTHPHTCFRVKIPHRQAPVSSAQLPLAKAN